jgi:hypothetical protein
MEESIDAIRERIHRKAAARTDATVYSLNNTYMTVPQKAQIEAVYQLPCGVMHYAFAFFALWMKYPIWNAWLAASGVGVVAWLFARFLPGRLFWPVGLACGGNGSTIICLLFAGMAVWLGLYGAAAYLALAGFGITSFVEVPMWLWTWSTRQRINPKYGIAKRMFGLTFPFEAELD